MQNTGFFSSSSNRFLVTAVLVMAVVALAAYAKLTFEQSKLVSYPGNFSVSGEAEVNAIPDIGQFSFSVNAEGETASAAQEESGTKINGILAYLKEHGIEEKDIKTEYYNLNPRWRYDERPCPFGSYCPSGEPVQDGFEVSQTVTVKIRALDSAGKIIAGVGELGATNISGLNFTVDDTETLRNQARLEAIANAKAKAEVLAKELGVTITRMTGYYEDEGYYPYPVYERSAVALDAAEGFGGPQLPVGEQTTKVRVNVSFEFRQ